MSHKLYGPLGTPANNRAEELWGLWAALERLRIPWQSSTSPPIGHCAVRLAGERGTSLA